VNHARRFAPPAVFVLVPSVLILPILFSGKMLYGSDVVTVFHSSRMVIAQAFREGRLPVWDSTVMAGFPLLAGLQAAVFYPPTWLCAFIPAGAFLTLSAWLHLILAGGFAHRWLERGLGVGTWAAMAGGCVFMLSGYIVAHLWAGHVTYLWAYPWIPALLWRVERFLAAPNPKRGALLSGALAMLVLTGLPQYVFFAGLLLLARGSHFVLGDREGRKDRAKLAGRLVAWLAIGLLLCAPQLLPTLELVSQMQRGVSESPEFLNQFSMPVGALKDLVFDAQAIHGADAWEWIGYIGGAALMLALAAHAGTHPQRHLWTGMAIVSILLAMGSHIPFYQGFVVVVPGAGLFRGPGRYLLLFTTGVVALVGLGFDAGWRRGRLLFRVPVAILAVAAGIQLYLFAKPLIHSIDPDYFHFPLENEKVLRSLCGSDGRVGPFRSSVSTIGICQAHGLDVVGGYEPMMLRRYAELMNAARGAPLDTNMFILSSVADLPVIDMLAVRAWVSSGWTITPQKQPMPRAWVVNNAAVLEAKQDRLRVLTQGPWDPRKSVILEEYPAGTPPVPTEAPAGMAQVISRKPGEYLLEAENQADAFLVLSEAYYPGWSAEVDGKPTEVLPANHLIQAVRLSPGKHVVRFAYRSRFLGVGVAIALLAAFAPAAIELVRRRRR
jgi:hypothetical protein